MRAIGASYGNPICPGVLPCVRAYCHVYGRIAMCTGVLPCVRAYCHVYGRIAIRPYDISYAPSISLTHPLFNSNFQTNLGAFHIESNQMVTGEMTNKDQIIAEEI
jgi:hypothetical protein